MKLEGLVWQNLKHFWLGFFHINICMYYVSLRRMNAPNYWLEGKEIKKKDDGTK